MTKKTKTEDIIESLGVETTTKKENKNEKQLREDFESWYDDIEEITDKGILLLKNGLEYKIALTNTKKPKLVKQTSKLYPKNKRKKFEIYGTLLSGVKKADQKEINVIIDADPTQELKYEQVYQLLCDITYTLKLTEQQYKSMVSFLKANKIGLNNPFYFRRFGKNLSTHFRFYMKTQIKVEKQAELKT